MSDLKARIGERRRYPADSGVHGHIKKLPANRKPSSSLGHHGHHSKYAASKYKTPFPTGSPSPSHALLQTLDSEPPSLLSRLNPMHADGASSHGDVVSPIDRIVGTKENDQFRELSSMDKPINVETPVEAPRIPVYGNGSFVVSQMFRRLFSCWYYLSSICYSLYPFVHSEHRKCHVTPKKRIQ